MGREVVYEARHYDDGILYVLVRRGNVTPDWCFHREAGGTYKGQGGYPYHATLEPMFTVPVSRTIWASAMRLAE